jgi:hypothetical protein
MQTSVGNVYDLVIRMYSSKNETLAAICKSSTELIEFMNSVNSLGNVKDCNCLCFFLQRILQYYKVFIWIGLPLKIARYIYTLVGIMFGINFYFLNIFCLIFVAPLADKVKG